MIICTTVCYVTHLFNSLLRHVYANINKISNNLIDIFSVEANFGELCGLNLNEWRLRQFSYSSRNLRLTTSCKIKSAEGVRR